MSSKISELFLKASSTPPATDINTGPHARLGTWIEACKMLDMQLEQWSTKLPDNWLPLIVSSKDGGDSLITHQRTSMAAIWNYYRAIRIVLQRLILDLHRTLAFMLGATDDTYQPDPAAVTVIRAMIADTCRSIPFSLGDVDSRGHPTRSMEGKPQIRAFHGYTLLWPMWYVISCGLATPAQTQQIRTVLSRVGSALGIKLASILAEAPEGQLPPENFMQEMRHFL